MNRKGQSAMEFLMTYGWAILVVLIAIGALAYFGVLNPARFLPSSCVVFPGISCGSFKIGTTTADFVIENGLGEQVTLFNLTMSNPNQGTCVTSGQLTANTGAGITLSDGQTSRLTITCAAGTSFGVGGDRYKADINVSYAEDIGANIIYHRKKGSIVAQVE